MKMIAGLGNPGQKYLFTRHNIGFMLMDVLAGGKPFQKKQESLILKTTLKDERVLLIKPQTFMNRSGRAIKTQRAFYKIPLSDLLVIHDDKDLRLGQMKFQKSRGHGGQGGVRNIIEELGSRDFCRLKMGIAPSHLPQQTLKPQETKKQTAQALSFSLWNRFFSVKKKSSASITTSLDTSHSANKKSHNLNQETSPAPIIKNTSRFVLAPFNPWEQKQLPLILEQGAIAVQLFVTKGFQAGANRFNSLNLLSSE